MSGHGLDVLTSRANKVLDYRPTRMAETRSIFNPFDLFLFRPSANESELNSFGHVLPTESNVLFRHLK